MRRGETVDEYKLYQLWELKGKTKSIFGRLLVTFVIGFAMSNFSLMSLILIYIMISWCWTLVKVTGNWLIGIVSTFVCLFVIYYKVSTLNISEEKAEILMAVLLLSVIIFDIINIIRYFSLKTSIIKNGMEIRKLSRAELKEYKSKIK